MALICFSHSRNHISYIFGVLIDTSCLKWGFKRCGSKGSCRLYDSNAFPGIIIKLFPKSHCYHI